jgi:hypothetical protein
VSTLHISLIVLIAFLWLVGGGKQAWARDWIIPAIVAITMLFHHQLWWICLLTFGSCQIIRMGYGAYDPEHDNKPSFLAAITHDRTGIEERAIYGFICGMIAPICIVAWGLTHGQPIVLLKMLGYAFSFASLCAFAAWLDKEVFAWERLPIDPVIGAGFATVLLWF